MKHKNGQWCWLTSKESIFLRQEDGTPKQIFGIVTDSTRRKQAENDLVQEKERLTVTLRSIGDGVITTDTGGRIVLINKVAENMTGWSQEEAFKKDIKVVFNIINAKTSQRCENPIEKVLETKTIVELSHHTNLIARDGTERMIADSGAPIFDSNSEIVGVVLVFRDVTEKYKIEKQLQQSQKMEAIGTLAGGIAHDFNNMLGVITGNISYALSNLNKNDELFEILSDVQESSKQAQNLTYQLLTFSKGGAPIKKVTDINRLIKESAIFSSRGAKANCNFELSDDLWPSEIDEGQINQVIGNLVINANQAMPNGGIITIRTENTEIDADSGFPLSPGRHIKIVVEDQGVGISKKHLINIFDPYFTTKQKGSGLGLAITYSIINNHGGHIAVYSELEKGTVFNIYLPATTKDLGKVEEKQEAMHTGQGKNFDNGRSSINIKDGRQNAQ
ncbi:PAS domain S-box protein [Desulfobacterales bacterium HSG16]|nr:PAS domain S-box protein [Desulfobacterales bacterium HSG16]